MPFCQLEAFFPANREMAAEPRPVRTRPARSCYRWPRGTTSRGRPMDLTAVREEGIEATTGCFWDKSGFVPDEHSEEWEDDYRRQFEQAKERHAESGSNQVKPVV